jgi:hypothetical protein
MANCFVDTKKGVIMLYRFIVAAIITTMCIVFLSKAAFSEQVALLETSLKTTEVKESDIQKGAFSLILYGGRHGDDIETFAILDYEGDSYTFEPYAPEFDYKIKKGLSSSDALKKAKKFVGFHRLFWRFQFSKILDTGGKVIGYEVRPLYLRYEYGTSDVMEIFYWLKDQGKIKVSIRLAPLVERIRFRKGGELSPGR